MKLRVPSRAPQKLGTMLQVCNPSTGDAEAKGLEVQGHRQIHSEFQASLCFADFVSKQTTKPKENNRKKERKRGREEVVKWMVLLYHLWKKTRPCGV